jgi:hypothetical protein
VFVWVFHRYVHDIARVEAAGVAELDFAVDFRDVGLGAAVRTIVSDVL